MAFQRFAGVTDDGRWITTFDGRIYDTQTETLGRYDTTSNGSTSNGSTHGGSITPNGSAIAIASKASNLVPIDTNLWHDAFVSEFK
jgi:hypothetical protein